MIDGAGSPRRRPGAPGCATPRHAWRCHAHDDADRARRPPRKPERAARAWLPAATTPIPSDRGGAGRRRGRRAPGLVLVMADHTRFQGPSCCPGRREPLAAANVGVRATLSSCARSQPPPTRPRPRRCWCAPVIEASSSAPAMSIVTRSPRPGDRGRRPEPPPQRFLLMLYSRSDALLQRSS